jgi:hypothetical protein
VAEHRSWLAAMGYASIRWFLGWEFKKIEKLEKKLDIHMDDVKMRLSKIDILLAEIAVRHGIEDRDPRSND